MRPRILLLLVLSAACATTRVGRGPSSLAPLPGETPEAASEGPDAVFRAAVAVADPAAARAALEGFVDSHPGHPLRDTAIALLARLALGQDGPEAAAAVLDKRAGGSTHPSVAFVRGLIQARLGRTDEALALLAPFAKSGPPPMGLVSDDESEMMLRSTLADAFAAKGDASAAFEQWDAFLRTGSIRPHEKAFIRFRADQLAARITAETAVETWSRAQTPITRAALGAKVAAALAAKGDAGGARRALDESRSLRQTLGWEGPPTTTGPGDPTRFGLAVPLSGRAHAVGEVALRGAMMAIADGPASRPAGETRPAFQLLVRDSAPDAPTPGETERPVAQLVQQEAVVGVVGTADRRATDEATTNGVPFLALDEQAPGGETTTFQMIHAPEARAVALARRALAAGVRRFAILGPDSASGKRLADAFKNEVVAGGGRVTGFATYVAGASSFSGAVTQIRGAAMDALFVPDDAERLELIAPALAVADLWSKGWSDPAPPPPAGLPPDAPKRRYVQLLSTARLLTERLVKNAGRYVQGALLAPGFYADPLSPRGLDFVSRYKSLYNQDPSATDAYAYDAVTLLRTAVERGARKRADVLTLLQSDSFEGVTGSIRFGRDHSRLDPPIIYAVEGETIKALP